MFHGRDTLAVHSAALIGLVSSEHNGRKRLSLSQHALYSKSSSIGFDGVDVVSEVAGSSQYFSRQ